MAPHWKCGSGQPVAGSNPALSATPRVGSRHVRLASPRTGRRRARRRLLRIEPHDLGDPRSSRWSWGRSGFLSRSWRIGRASSWATRSATGAGSSCSTRGSASATRSSTTPTTRSRGAIADVLAEAGIALADVTAVANCHLHADHAGQNRRSRTSRSTSSRPSGRSPTPPTTRSSNGSTFPAPTTSRSRGDHEPFDGHPDRRDARPHAGPPVARRRRRTDGLMRPRRPGGLHGRRVGGRRRTRSRAGQRARIARPTTARSSACARSTRRASTSATTGGPGPARPDVEPTEPGYPSGAVLGGELAVPCTCNPLQQG